MKNTDPQDDILAQFSSSLGSTTIRPQQIKNESVASLPDPKNEDIFGAEIRELQDQGILEKPKEPEPEKKEDVFGELNLSGFEEALMPGFLKNDKEESETEDTPKEINLEQTKTISPDQLKKEQEKIKNLQKSEQKQDEMMFMDNNAGSSGLGLMTKKEIGLGDRKSNLLNQDSTLFSSEPAASNSLIHRCDNNWMSLQCETCFDCQGSGLGPKTTSQSLQTLGGIAWLTIGDFGYKGNAEQKKVAFKMNQIASEEQMDFVVSTGDNFYDPVSNTKLNDQTWEQHWTNVYQQQPNLSTLDWFGVLGNRDYDNQWIEAEFYNRKNGWRIDDYFWSHTMDVENETLSFVHIDTNFLAYGERGEPGSKFMVTQFEKYNWNESTILSKIEKLLQANQGSTYKIAVGHHPIGPLCGKTNGLPNVQPLLKKYGFQSYLCGHNHKLGYASHKGISYYLSGAGGNNQNIKDSLNSVKQVYGFSKMRITDGKLHCTYYYSNDQGSSWKAWNAPIFDLINQKEISKGEQLDFETAAPSFQFASSASSQQFQPQAATTTSNLGGLSLFDDDIPMTSQEQTATHQPQQSQSNKDVFDIFGEVPTMDQNNQEQAKTNEDPFNIFGDAEEKTEGQVRYKNKHFHKFTEYFTKQMPNAIIINSKAFNLNTTNYSKSRAIHRNIDINWLIKNQFVKFKGDPITLEYKNFKYPKGTMAYIGEYDSDSQPAGFLRCVNQFGNIYEGNIAPNLKIYGFCVSFIGQFNQIQIGWYKNNHKQGNWMSLRGNDLSVIESGWYVQGSKVGEMRDSEEYKNFSINDIFVNSRQSTQVSQAGYSRKIQSNAEKTTAADYNNVFASQKNYDSGDQKIDGRYHQAQIQVGAENQQQTTTMSYEEAAKAAQSSEITAPIIDNWLEIKENPEERKRKLEPHFILINERDQFRLICDAQDEDQCMRDEMLVIEKKTCKIYPRAMKEQGQTHFESGHMKVPNYGLIGIINIELNQFIIIITQRAHIGKLPQGDYVYQIQNIEIIPFDMQLYYALPKEINEYIKGIKQVLEHQGFYYSYHADLTSNQQRQASIKFEYQSGINYSCKFRDQNMDKRYQWNESITQDFTLQHIDPFWYVPIIQGYIQQKLKVFDSLPMDVMLINRRRRAMSGTRFLSRGIDDDSNVANFVETEIIVAYNQHFFSFNQIRGSIPLFWEQKQKNIHKVWIKRNEYLTQHVFQGHIDDLIQNYSRIVMINLARELKNDEQELTKSFERLLELQPNKEVKYISYDIHAEMEDVRLQRINKLLGTIKGIQDEHGFFMRQIGGEQKVISEQGCVFRTNCIDCLDRTNVIQMRICIQALEQILNLILINNNTDRTGMQVAPFDGKFGNFAFGQKSIYNDIRQIFMNNGDAMSYQYTGTESNSDIARDAKDVEQTISSQLKKMSTGMSRYYQSFFNDETKHSSIQLIHGEHPRFQKPYSYGIRKLLENKMMQNNAYFTEQQQLQVTVVTWNCDGNIPQLIKAQNVLYDPSDQNMEMSDIYIVGLQQMVEFTAYQVAKGKDKDQASRWEGILLEQLNMNPQRQKYISFIQKAMVGQFIIMFAKEEHKNSIKNLSRIKVKAGFGGVTGNKGSVGIRFNFNDTSFAFVNCHLESGQNNASTRIDQVKQICNKTFSEFVNVNTRNNWYIDYTCIFGDLNFRIDLPNNEVRALVYQKNYEFLHHNDQLMNEKARNPILGQFSEGPLIFDPTYKYDANCNIYDTIKGRSPAYCDRILFCRDPLTKKNLVDDKHENDEEAAMPIMYNRIENTFSDHRPVIGVFQVQAIKINQEAKDEFQEQILQELLFGKTVELKKSLPKEKRQAQEQQKEKDQTDEFDLLGDFGKATVQEEQMEKQKQKEENQEQGQKSTVDDSLLQLGLDHQKEQTAKQQATSDNAIDDLFGF